MKILLDTQLISWRDELLAAVPDGTLYTLTPDIDPITQIVDIQPNLILIDADHLPFWTATSRSSPATRRIPMLGIGIDHQNARGHGVTICLTPEEFRVDLAGTVTNYALFYTQFDALQEGCAGKLPPLALKGLHLFNEGKYYEAHEELELAWRDEPNPVRETYRAVLQIAVAYHLIIQKNYHGAMKLFLRSVQWFAPLPDVCQGINIKQLKTDAVAVRAHLEMLGMERIAEFDHSLLKRVVFEEST